MKGPKKSLSRSPNESRAEAAGLRAAPKLPIGAMAKGAGSANRQTCPQYLLGNPYFVF